MELSLEHVPLWILVPVVEQVGFQQVAVSEPSLEAAAGRRNAGVEGEKRSLPGLLVANAGARPGLAAGVLGVPRLESFSAMSFWLSRDVDADAVWPCITAT